MEKVTSQRTKVTRALNVTCILDVCWRGHLWTLNKVWNRVKMIPGLVQDPIMQNDIMGNSNWVRDTGKHSVLSLQLLVLLVAKIAQNVLICPTLRVQCHPLEVHKGPQGAYTFQSIPSTKFKFPLQHLLPQIYYLAARTRYGCSAIFGSSFIKETSSAWWQAHLCRRVLNQREVSEKTLTWSYFK